MVSQTNLSSMNTEFTVERRGPFRKSPLLRVRATKKYKMGVKDRVTSGVVF